jgi:hypothetical protein
VLVQREAVADGERGELLAQVGEPLVELQRAAALARRANELLLPRGVRVVLAVVPGDDHDGVVAGGLEDGLEVFVDCGHGGLVAGLVPPLREVRRRSIGPMHLPDVEQHEPRVDVRAHLLDDPVAPVHERHLVALPVVGVLESPQDPRLREQRARHLGMGAIAGLGERLGHGRDRRREAVSLQPTHPVLGRVAARQDRRERRGRGRRRRNALAKCSAAPHVIV